MIELPIRGIRVCFHFSFFAAVTLLMLWGSGSVALYGMYACLLHESGHLVAMIILRRPVKRLIFYGAGIKLVQGENETLVKFTYQLAILAAGCMVNFVLYAVCGGVFAMMNLLVGLFNMLPLCSLDGGKIISLCFYRILSYERAVTAEKILRGINIVLIPAAAIAFYLAGAGNFTLYVTLIYLLYTAVIM